MIKISEPSIETEEIAAVEKVLKSGMLVQGPVVEELEKEFAKYIGVKHAVAVSNGTAAIHSILAAFDIKKGDEVITTPFTFIASASPILMVGAKPVFADINEKDFNINPKEVEKKLTTKTKAVIPVNLFGKVYAYKSMKTIAEKNKLKILEDACQSVGALQDGKKSGCFGDAAAFSFYATKNMMCGEGGMVVTDSDKIYEKCKKFRHHGQTQKYGYDSLGYNYRMTDIMAAILLVQLRKIDSFCKKRNDNAKKYTTELQGVKGLLTPKIESGNVSSFNQYTIRITPDFEMSRERLYSILKEKGIGCGIYYPKPLHLHPIFKKLGYKKGDFPVSEKLAEEVLSLPVHPMLSDEDLSYIIKSIKNAKA